MRNTLVCCSMFFQCAVWQWHMPICYCHKGSWNGILTALVSQCFSVLGSWAAFDNNLSFAGRSQETDCWKNHSVNALAGCSPCVSCLGCPDPSVSVLEWKSWQRARASIKQASQCPAPLQFLLHFPLLLFHLPLLCTTVARRLWGCLIMLNYIWLWGEKVVGKVVLKQMIRWLQLV